MFLECERYVWCPTEPQNNFMGNTYFFPVVFVESNALM